MCNSNTSEDYQEDPDIGNAEQKHKSFMINPFTKLLLFPISRTKRANMLQLKCDVESTLQSHPFFFSEAFDPEYHLSRP